VSDRLLSSTQEVSIVDGPTALEFRPTRPQGTAALLFVCGSGIHPHAYAPLLRPIAESGYRVFIVKLPYRFAPLARHKDEVVDRARTLIAAHPETSVAQADHGLHGAFVLIGTTHPRDDDLSGLDAPFTKVYATRDGIAPVDRVMASKSLLPTHTKWIEIDGGNHSQFGHYGHQLFDGTATISREVQQAVTREALLESLRKR
jgi:pimeloyl-ACP methyl ester carboxylesterase